MNTSAKYYGPAGAEPTLSNVAGAELRTPYGSLYLNRIRTRARRTFMLALAALALPSFASAQDNFPDRPIRIVVGFVAGGVSDVLARMLAPELSRSLGQPVIVENRPGAAGMIAADQVAKGPADGYTLYMAPNTHLINHAINPNIPFDSVKDFRGITLLATTPNMLVVRNDSPFQDVADFVKAAKAKPGSVTYATSGIGTTVHFAGELLAHAAGVQLNHIPYKGANQSVEAVVGGHVDSSASALSSTLPFIKSNRVRVLGVMADKRSRLLPNVPTFQELGYTELLSETWLGLIGPAGIPDSTARRLDSALQKILAQPEFRERVLGLGSEPVGLGLKAFDEQMQRELDGYIRIAKSAGIKPQ